MLYGTSKKVEYQAIKDMPDSPTVKSSACQTIAHRGCRTHFAENTMGAFRAAVADGSNAIETDIHLTADGVVVISHDSDLKRCFGVDRKIIDCDYAYIKTLRTVKSPHEHMPTLKELLEYLCTPGAEHVWLLLDIKVDNHPEDVIRLIGEAILGVNPNVKFWAKRVRLGVWSFEYVEICRRLLPEFHITFIGFNMPMVRPWLSLTNVSLNLADMILFSSEGIKLIQEAHANDIEVFMWTVNDIEMMKWALKHGLDGVCTDFPGKFRKLAEHYEGENPRIRVKDRIRMLVVRLCFAVYGFCMTPIEVAVNRKMREKKKRVGDRVLEAEGDLLLSERP